MNKQQKIYILVIMIILMLLGIGLEAFQTGSSFLCTYSSSYASSAADSVEASTSHTILTKNLFILEGIRQSYSTSCIRHASRRICTRNNRIGFSLIALIIILPFLHIFADIAVVHDSFQEILCFMVIIGYIHLSDGKKPRYS